ncbi:hypothetical protein FRC12_009692 [Ceratobasidium sp. 428]|nr:hypothetical protein FRC12_009692 [Ceratobasidium sp. 428]
MTHRTSVLYTRSLLSRPPRLPSLSLRIYSTRTTRMSRKPEIIKKEVLSADQAKWVTLERILWKDQDGKERPWEVASRKTRGESGIDAVAVLAILKSKSDTFRPSTIIIEQVRQSSSR